MLNKDKVISEEQFEMDKLVQNDEEKKSDERVEEIKESDSIIRSLKKENVEV